MSHALEHPVTVKVRRAWSDLAPKLLAFLATGLTASGLVTLAAYFGFVLDVGLASALVVAVSAIAGYFVKDNVTVTPGQVLAASDVRVQNLPETSV